MHENEDAALFDRYGQAIFAYTRLHTPSREDAEDVTLEVFTAALEQYNLAALPENERLAWLHRVAHNKIVDYYRRAQRHPLIAIHMVAEMQSDEESGPEQFVMRKEMSKQLHMVIASLPHLQQQLLRLRYGDDLCYTEIALLLNKREDAVRKMLSRTLALLRTKYSQLVEGGK